MDKAKLEGRTPEELERMRLTRVSEIEKLSQLHGVPSHKHRDLYLKLMHSVAQIDFRLTTPYDENKKG